MILSHLFQPKQISKRLKYAASCGLAVAAALTMWAAPEVASAQTRDIIFSIPDLTLTSADTSVTVPLTLDAPGTASVGGFQFNLEYDSSKLTVASCTPTLGLFGNCNISTAGAIRANGISLSPIANGEIYSIVFDVVNGATGTSTLDLTVTEATEVPSVADLTDRAEAIDGSVGIDIRSLMNESLGNYVYDENATTHGALGELTIDFDFEYTSGESLQGIYNLINTANNAVVVNTDSGVGGVGSTLTTPNSALPGGNNQFDAGETLTVQFVIAIEEAPWGVDFNMFGSNAENADPAPVQSFRIDSAMFDLEGVGSEAPTVTPVLYLPLYN